MGFALAEAAVQAGWTVDLVADRWRYTEPEGVILCTVVTAAEMYHQIDALFDACDVLIMTAAVSDFRPKVQHAHKQKKGEAELSIDFERTVDILKTVTVRKAAQTVVGFAAETNDLEAYARRKLQEKRCDWIVANDISKEGAGFAADTNEVLLIGADGNSRTLGPASKPEIARQLIASIAAVAD